MSEDELEAASIKYNIARIVRLSSGAFALYAPWSNSEGMPMITIGSWTQLESFIPSAAEVTDWRNDRDDRAEFDEVKGKMLLESLGLSKPKPKLERRI